MHNLGRLGLSLLKFCSFSTSVGGIANIKLKNKIFASENLEKYAPSFPAEMKDDYIISSGHFSCDTFSMYYRLSTHLMPI